MMSLHHLGLICSTQIYPNPHDLGGIEVKLKLRGRLDDDQSMPCRATAATPHFSTPFGSLQQAAIVAAMVP
jgi:hypothetical protein